MVGAGQPQGLCLVPITSQFIALLAQLIMLMTHGDIPTIPVYSSEEPGFILVQLDHGECPCTSLYCACF
jgi:hypothetical protein